MAIGRANCTFYYFKLSGKWKYEGRGVFPPARRGIAYTHVDRRAIKEANGGGMPGINSDALDLIVVLIPDEECNEPHAYPRMLHPTEVPR